jgi:TrpR-related protein YerC/YecD
MKQKHLSQATPKSATYLYEALASLKNASEARQFLEDLCTPTELQAMIDRWWVVKFLRQGKPYREIYDLTGVSLTTISRVARTLELGEGGYTLVAERIEG